MSINHRKSLLSHSSAIMESIDSLTIAERSLPPDIIPEGDSCSLGPISEDTSFHLIDGKEYLKITSAEQFIKLLKCEKSDRVKVVSIFGNTGDGKSFTLNHTFFEGRTVFQTSCKQDSCTLGVWAAFDPLHSVICLDTEGLLGATNHENQRTRLLLKVLAVSDIVIYRTRSNRLHRDLYTFLGSASRAYTLHFQSALQRAGQRVEFGGSASALGPAVIIFHETQHTDTLPSNSSESAEDILRRQFVQMKLEIEAFSSLRYIGTKTISPPTCFSELRKAIVLELKNTTVRSARQPQVVYHTLKVLNDKFSGEIENSASVLFPDQYFTCPIKCLSCEQRCEMSMGHLTENLDHSCSSRCKYQHQYENCTYICKTCHTNGQEVIVIPKLTSSSESSWFGLAKFAWSGYVIECPNCGEIYRSRQFWYGNKNPEDSAVRTEIKHVWPGSKMALVASQNAAQKVLDGVTYISEAVANVGSPPTRLISSWVADQIAPKYWRPNHEIKHCHACRTVFAVNASKHHCRSCGEGFCENCSSKTTAVPDRGWHSPVRVCDTCFKQVSANSNLDVLDDIDDTEVRVRKYGEVVVNTISTVASVLEYPRDLIKSSARPTYWVPDHEVSHCCCCEVVFGPQDMLHHCRDCGRGVCAKCSPGRRPVLRRGWDNPVRVCDQCLKQD
uniref:FYVE-type domain-containing protein n=1 Tax=Timema monikensis TaxID=170555 RepID=A0A7R9HJ41_9NEOP|nr:unnamed protein product [Timema monikensis]